MPKVTVYVDSSILNRVGVVHSWIGLDSGDGQEQVYGFHNRDANDTVNAPGIISNDMNRGGITSQMTIEVTDNEFNIIADRINGLIDYQDLNGSTPFNYSATPQITFDPNDRNCSMFENDLINAAGIRIGLTQYNLPWGHEDWIRQNLPSWGQPIWDSNGQIYYEPKAYMPLAARIKPLSDAINSLYLSGRNWAPSGSPLVIDLDGDGIETVGIQPGSPILFDNDADGIKTGTGWIKPDDGLLVLDRDGNGTIDTGRELFGVQTLMSNAEKAADGFAALRDLDSNADSKFNASDAQFANVKVWQGLSLDCLKNAA